MERLVPVDRLSPQRRRRLVQGLFIVVNLALVEAHLPGPLWLAVGALFWLGLIGITLAGSELVCGSMCWIGAIQDFCAPFARSRVRLDARLGRAVTLGLAIAWMPIGWFVAPALAAHDRTPLDLSLGWERHAFQFALAALVALSVTFLGKRGICKYLCPFNSVVAQLRRVLRRQPPAPAVASKARVPCAGSCATCTQSHTTSLERVPVA
jgi:polyferredoxin